MVTRYGTASGHLTGGQIEIMFNGPNHDALNCRYLATGSKDATVIIWEFDPELMQLRQRKVL